MDAHFTFETTAFLDSDEVRAQNVNGFTGHTLAAWLVERLKGAGLDATGPWAEDHGWDFSVEHEGATYLIACHIADDEEPPHEGHVVLAKSRSVMDKLRGRNAFMADDAVAGAIEAALKGSGDVAKLERD